MNQTALAKWDRLEEHHKNIQVAEHPNRLVEHRFADQMLYCYGRSGHPCVGVHQVDNDPVLDLSNREPVHFGGCCLMCCKTGNEFGVCPCDVHRNTASEMCFGTQKGPCSTFEATKMLQSTHGFGVCLRCATEWNGGYCVCQECVAVATRNVPGVTCYGTTAYECVSFVAKGVRVVYKNAKYGGVCSACNTKWNELNSFKHSVKQETTLNEIGKQVVKARKPAPTPSVIFRTGTTLDHVNKKNPVKYVPTCPKSRQPVLTMKAAFIHPWYQVPIRQCIVCRSVHHPNVLRVANFDICEQCYQRWTRCCESGGQWDFFPLPYQQLINLSQPLDDIVESYSIPTGSFKIVFMWCRYSPPRKQPPKAYFDKNFILQYKSMRYIDSDQKVLAGSGRTYIVPDKYYKTGQSDSTLVGILPWNDYPNWNNLVVDVNRVLDVRPLTTINIAINRMDDVSTSAFHMQTALKLFKYPKRTYFVVRNISTNPNRSGTCSVFDLLELLNSVADFTGRRTVAEECLFSAYKETQVTNKETSKHRSDDKTNPKFELFLSQPSTQGGSQSQTFQQPIIGTEPEVDATGDDGMVDISFTESNRQEFHPPALFSLTGPIMATLRTNSGDAGFAAKKDFTFLTEPSVRQPKKSTKSKRENKGSSNTTTTTAKKKK